jgi:phosphopantothenoylcysteine decarboxylase/phosphopantothenate--cysteine ligase
MAEPDEILDAARWVLGRGGPLAGRRVLVTAGGTREPLDPIRYLGNRSSGRMGHALALSARDRGAGVTLVRTTGGPAPCGTEVIEVETAAEMAEAVLAALPDTHALLMAAAVADYRPASVAGQKIKKGAGGLSLELERTVDILSRVAERSGADQLIVGFAAETENLVANARAKLEKKRLDWIVANDARQAMGAETNRVTLLTAAGDVEAWPLLAKEELADRLLDRVAAWLAAGREEG